MSTRRPALERISMTIPSDVRRRADQLARQLDRSRSWIIADAIRRYSEEPADPARQGMVSEPPQPAYLAAEVARGRTDQLRRALALTPAKRLLQAEALVGLARIAHPRPKRRQIIAFETLEDFAQWKKARRAGG